MKTVAIFSGFYLPFLGGIERYTYNIVQKFIDKGYNVVIVTSQHDKDLPTKEEFDHLKIYRLPIRKIWKNRYPFPLKNERYKQLISDITSEPIDYYVVNTRFQLPALLGAQLAKKAGKEALVLEHGTTYLTLNNSLLDSILHRIEHFLVKKIKKNTKTFYGVSKEATEWLKTFGIEAKGVIYNAIDLDDFEKYFSPKLSEKIVISYSGRLQAKFKGVEMLLEAFSELSKERNNLELKIAGDGPIYSEMIRKYSQENIQFLGHISHEDVMRLNNHSDIFVLMSKIEGFSTSMLEAALMNNVIVTTNVGGATELIPNQEYGYVIKDDKETLLKTLKLIVDDTKKMAEIQKRVHDRVVENFNWNKSIESFEQAFVELEKIEIN